MLMHPLHKMIQELCPRGVKWVKLGEVCEVVRGERVVKKDLLEVGDYPVISGGVTPMGYLQKYNREKNTITVSQYGTAGYVDFQKTRFWANDICYCLLPHNILDNKYLLYVLKAKQNILYAIRNTDAVPYSLSQQALKAVNIPLPPLPIQEEIVKTLDTFSALLDNIDEEIAQREKQYEYYREKLLTFKEGECEWKKLGEVCEIKGRIGFRGYTREDQVKKGEGAISLSPANIISHNLVFENCTYITWDKYDESPEIKVFINDIILCKTASVGKVAIIKELLCESTINPQLVVLKKITCDNKYLYYCIESNVFQNYLKQKQGIGSVPNISQENLSSAPIPLPSPSRQAEIVAQLDAFEAIINNLKAEREQRQKQYEYYREALLNFKNDRAI